MSRLDFMIARLTAQRALLAEAARQIGDRPGCIFELGLGSGRTYDHLRELFPDREIFAFDRAISATKSIPDGDHMILGEIRETLAFCGPRIPSRPAFINVDLGSGDPTQDLITRSWLSPLIREWAPPGTIVLADRPLEGISTICRGQRGARTPATVCCAHGQDEEACRAAMNVAFYAPLKPPDHPVASGDRAMARALISALELGGHRVTLASRFRSFDAGDPARQERLRKVGLRMAGHVARRFESAAKPDAWFTYHLYHKAPDWLGPAVSERLAIPYVVAEASFAPKQDRGPWAIGHRGVGEALAHADRVFQPNPGDNACILPMLKCPDRLVPLKPFLDTRPFKANRPANRAEAAKRFGLDPSAPWLLAVAMMRNDQKLQSYRVLAEALRQLTDLPWELVVAGVGPAEAAVRSAFSDFADRIRWLGMLDRTQMIALYRGADLLVWPAIKEAWGMALLEAQAAGLPVVAGRSPGVAVVVADGVSGTLVREGDAVAFAGAVRQLLLRPDLRNTMREAAAERIGREHDIRIASAFLDRELAGLVGARKG